MPRLARSTPQWVLAMAGLIVAFLGIYLGQITGRVDLPDHMIQPGVPAWARRRIVG